MKLYKVYLLDDEPFILEGLKYIVPWEEYGFEIVGSSSNGEDGFNNIKNKDIDLIITDIMMPKMTGLELMGKLKKEKYNTNFLVLSAFQEFKYAKEAINMGAENYLLKPIDTEELSNNLKSIYEKIKKKEENILDKNIVKNNLLKKLIIENYEENILDKLKALNIEFSDNKYCIINIEISDKLYNIEDIISKLSKDKSISCVRNKSNVYLIIDEENIEDIMMELIELKSHMINTKGPILYISVGAFVNNIKEINSSFKTCMEVNEYKMIYPNKSWIKIYKEKLIMNEYDSLEFEELKKILGNKEFSKTEEYISSIFTKLKYDEKLTPKQIKMKSIEIFLNVYNYFNESKVIKDLHKYFDYIVNNNNTVDDIQIQLVNMLRYIQSKLEQTEKSMSPVIIKLLDYIEENYKYDLNLKEISDKLNINSIYLGQLFQREIGILFSDYINNFRVNKAKKLLSDTSLKASEIGVLVGYTNKNYFYRKFKNIAGLTPSEWRKINL